jgi:hypothetical protein
MSLVLDAGALIAYERADRLLAGLLEAELRAERVPITHGGVVGQVWRGGVGRQASLARLLLGTKIVSLDDALGRRAGLLLRKTRTRDVIDAAIVLVASDGDIIVTSDAGDLVPLVDAAGLHVDIVEV